MDDSHSDGNRHANIWAPWRMAYIGSLGDENDPGCFLCRARDETDRDADNLVLWRGPRTITVLNRFPYTGGHAMVAPLEHAPEMADLAESALLEMMCVARDLQAILAEAVKAQGFNIGFNVGRCAGAGLPDHLHLHVVPRWPGDVNMISVLGNVRVMVVSLEELYEAITQAGRKLGLPRFDAKG